MAFLIFSSVAHTNQSYSLSPISQEKIGLDKVIEQKEIEERTLRRRVEEFVLRYKKTITAVMGTFFVGGAAAIFRKKESLREPIRHPQEPIPTKPHKPEPKSTIIKQFHSMSKRLKGIFPLKEFNDEKRYLFHKNLDFLEDMIKKEDIEITKEQMKSAYEFVKKIKDKEKNKSVRFNLIRLFQILSNVTIKDQDVESEVVIAAIEEELENIPEYYDKWNRINELLKQQDPKAIAESYGVANDNDGIIFFSDFPISEKEEKLTEPLLFTIDIAVDNNKYKINGIQVPFLYQRKQRYEEDKNFCGYYAFWGIKNLNQLPQNIDEDKIFEKLKQSGLLKREKFKLFF